MKNELILDDKLMRAFQSIDVMEFIVLSDEA